MNKQEIIDSLIATCLGGKEENISFAKEYVNKNFPDDAVSVWGEIERRYKLYDGLG